MARAISKNSVTSTIFGLNCNVEFDIDSNGQPIANVIISDVNGKVSNNQAFKMLVNKCNHSNVMVLDIVHTVNTNSVSAIDFYNNSFTIDSNATTTHDMITREFTITKINVMVLTSVGVFFDTAYYMGKTTQNKQLKFIRDIAMVKGSFIKGVSIKSVELITEKRAMSVSRYMSL